MCLPARSLFEFLFEYFVVYNSSGYIVIQSRFGFSAHFTSFVMLSFASLCNCHGDNIRDARVSKLIGTFVHYVWTANVVNSQNTLFAWMAIRQDDRTSERMKWRAHRYDILCMSTADELKQSNWHNFPFSPFKSLNGMNVFCFVRIYTEQIHASVGCGNLSADNDKDSFAFQLALTVCVCNALRNVCVHLPISARTTTEHSDFV